MTEPLATFEQFASLVRTRRTSLLMDRGRPVPPELVEQLCRLAVWAPNHKKTWPGRVAEFTGDGRARLGETMAADMVAADFGDAGKRDKTRTKYLRAPTMLVVGCAPHENELLDIENRDAVAAGIQNLLLGATALGLASFWSSPALTSAPRVLELCGFDAGDRLVAMIYLGWPDGSCPAPDRPDISISRVTG
ncbi:MAG: nitroreductase [Ilumatobacter sp.]|nr:nitroreductase [Ilumatobacter sp.]